jgi:outer membrane cobalamin receptor
MKWRLIIGVFLCLSSNIAWSQNDVLSTKISIRSKKQSIPEILKAIERQSGATFSYNLKIIPEGKFSIYAKNEELNVVLVRLLQPHKLAFSVLYGKHLVISKLSKDAAKYTISGYVSSELSGEKLIGVTVYDRNSLQSCLTNSDGFYTLTLPSDTVQLIYALSGYHLTSRKLNLTQNIVQNVVLRDHYEYTRFTVTSKPDHQTNFKPDEFHFNGQTLKQFPVLFGESDVMKGLQLLPGVSAGNDGTIGLNIRGGGPDQNLILLDDVPLYNPSHIYGFFSVFNSDVIKDVKLLKGGMGSRYSGRLSSVIDVRTLDGNTKKIKFQASLGLLSSKLTVDGPIDKKAKTTFILSGRRSYIDILGSALNAFSSDDIAPFSTGYYFYDLNGKITHSFNENHQLAFSFYTGLDNSFIKNSFKAKDPDKLIKEKDRQTVFWGNRIFSLRDHHIINPKLSATVNASFTTYNFGNESNYEYSESTDSLKIENSYDYKFISRINNSILSYNLEYKPAGILSIKAGAGMVYHEFKREITSSDIIVQRQVVNYNTISALEYSYYTDAIWKLRRNLVLNSGFHYVNYTMNAESYKFVQPRFSLNYKPLKGVLFHLAYQNTAQFLHLLTSNTFGIPLDLWLPSTKQIKPETATSYSGGIGYSKGDYLINAEAFFKEMNNIIAYKDQSNYLGTDNNWEDKVTTGKGRAFGYEFLVEKRNGKTTGWVSYTLSWNYRQFELINNGKEFPYIYDRRHNLAILLNHQFSKRIDASMSWVYATGANFTLPEQVYYVQSGIQKQNVIYVYGERNNFKFPDYHRLDFSVNFKKNHFKYTRMISIGAYNVYNRLNPFYVNPAYNDEGKRVFEAVSLFPVLPSINYKIIF